MTEIDMYLDFLILTLQADDVIDDSKVEFIINIGKSLNLNESQLSILLERIKRRDINSDNLIQEISSKANPTFVMNLIKDSYSIAKSDGCITSSEKLIIKKLIESFGTYNDNTYDEIVDWCEDSIFLKIAGYELFNKISESK